MLRNRTPGPSLANGKWRSETSYNPSGYSPSNLVTDYNSFVMCGVSTNNTIYVSAINSNVWTTVTLPTPTTSQQVGAMWFNSSINYWVALGRNGSCSWRCSGSNDPTLAANWTVTNFTALLSGGLLAFNCACVYSNACVTIINDGVTGASEYIVYSTDGVAWTRCTNTTSKTTSDNSSAGGVISINSVGATTYMFYPSRNTSKGYYFSGTLSSTSYFTQSSATPPWIYNSFNSAWTKERGFIVADTGGMIASFSEPVTYSSSVVNFRGYPVGSYVSYVFATPYSASLPTTVLGFVLNSTGVLPISYDGGLTWTPILIPSPFVSNFSIAGVTWANATTLYILGSNASDCWVLNLSDSTYGVSVAATSIYENNSVTFTITTTNVPDNTTLYWTTSGTTSSADFSDSTVSGSVTIVNNSATVIRTLVYDFVTDNGETLRLQLRTGSITGAVVASSPSITVYEGVSMSPGSSTFNEGVTYTGYIAYRLSVSQVIYWEIVNITTTASNWSGATSGTVTLSGTSAPYSGYFSYTTAVVAGLTDKTFQIRLRLDNSSGNVIYTTSILTLTGMNGSIVSQTTTVYEAATSAGSYYPVVSFKLMGYGGSGIAAPTIYWTILHGTTSNADFVTGIVSGSTTLSSWNSSAPGYYSGAVYPQLATDPIDDQDETFQVEFRWGSTSGTVLATSAPITVKSPTAEVIGQSTTVYEAATSAGSYYPFVSVKLYNWGGGVAAPNIYWTILHGTTSDADFVTLGGSITLGSWNSSAPGYYAGTVYPQLATDIIDDQDETFQVEFRWGSTTGYVMATSAPITVKSPTAEVIGQSTTVYEAATSAGSYYPFVSVKLYNWGGGVAAPTIYWTILHGTTSNADFVAGTVSGSITLGSWNASTPGYYAGTVYPQLVTDLIDDQDETFQVEFRWGSTTGYVMATSAPITVKSPTAEVIGQSTTVYEAATSAGSYYPFVSVRLYNWGGGVAAPTIYWTILHGTTSDADFVTLGGSITLSAWNASTPGYYAGTVYPQLVTDLIDDQDETFQVQFRWGSTTGYVMATSAAITVKSPTAEVVGQSTTVYEAATSAGSYFPFVTVRLYNWGGGVAAPTIYWTILHGTTSDADFVAGTVSGSLALSAWNASAPGYYSGTVYPQLVTDLIDDKDETFQVQFRWGSTTGYVMATSAVITVRSPTLSFITPPTSIDEGSIGYFNVRLYDWGGGAAAAPTIYWTILHGTTSDADFSAVSGSLALSAWNASTPGYYAGTFSISPVTDASDPGQTFQVQMRWGSTTGYVLATSAAITVTEPLGTISASPYNSGGLMTLNFSGTNGATTSTIDSGSLSASTLTLTSATLSTTHGPASGRTSLRVDSVTTGASRAEVTGFTQAPTSFTVEGWVWLSSIAPGGYSTDIFSLGLDYMNLLDVRWNSSTQVEFRTNISNSSVGQGGWTTATTALSTGVWQHHAVTADGTTYKYYLNGALIASVALGGTWGYNVTANKNITAFAVGNWLANPWSGGTQGWFWNFRLSSTVTRASAFTVSNTGMY